MSTDRIPMSKEGYDRLKAQLDKMKNEDMPRIAEQIARRETSAIFRRMPSSTRPARRRACFRRGSTSFRTSSAVG